MIRINLKNILFSLYFFVVSILPCCVNGSDLVSIKNDNVSRQMCYDLMQKRLKDKLNVIADDEDWTTGSQMIDFVYVGAHYNKIIKSIDEARKLIVDTTEFVAKFLNEEPLIRPYLCEYPFNSRNINVMIVLDRNIQMDEPIVDVSCDQGVIRYFYEYNRIQVPKETFEEAKAIVAASSRNNTFLSRQSEYDK